MLKYTTTILLLAGPAAIHAQPSDPARAQFADQLDVRLVHVDVRVERRGKPVTDLGIEDFLLLEDGKPVEIAVFSPTYKKNPKGDAERPAEALPVVLPEPGAQASTGNGGTVAVFIDDVSLGPGQRNRALRTVQALSDPSNPNGAGLVVFRHFRRGRLTLQLGQGTLADEANFQEMSRASAVREQQGIFFAMREIENVLAHSNCIDSRAQLLGVADDYSATALASSEMRAQLLGDAIEYLSALPGRKVLIVVAGRIELQPGAAILEHLQDLCPDLSSELSNRILSAQNMANRLHRVAGLANSHRVTLVTVDARGIGAPSQANAALDSARFGGTQLNQMITNANLQSGLTQLASETGGTTIFNANNVVRPVLRSLEEAEAVYTLAFYPQHERTGERRVLEVRLVGDAKRRTKLHYRRSYMDRTMQQEWADGLRTAARAPDLRPDASLPNPLAAQLLVTEDPDGIVVSLGLGTDAVTTLLSLSPQSERRLRLWLYVVDPEGRETAAREGFLAGPSAPGPWQASVRLDLPVGEWTVAAGLRDEVTGEISLLRQTAPPAL
ncbi:MAG: VWA domain-containing protein [Holophagales bacterium]|nr:VWA domain-containing protein [Holophagales bacterium]